MDEKGLTLIEVLLGVVILGTAIAPVAALLGGTLRGPETRAAGARSLHLAQGRMEELLALDYDALKQGPLMSDWIAAPDSIERRVTITLNPGGTFDPNIKGISVTIGTVTMTCIRANAFEP